MAWGLRLARRKGSQKPATAEQAPAAEKASSSPVEGEPAQKKAARITPAPRSALANFNQLRQQVLDLYGQRIPREEFATQTVQLVAKAMQLDAAALLAYEPRRDRLVLVGSVGLKEQAYQLLDGAGGGPAWDIPMRGLSNRRISVIESAHQNPFVPRPLIEVSPRRLTIASMPFFHGQVPSGVLVLLSGRPGSLSNAQLHSLSQLLKVCALALAELPRTPVAEAGAGRAPGQARETAQPGWEATETRQRLADAEELARLRTAFDEALWQHAKELAESRRTAAAAVDAERARVTSVESKLAEIEADRDRIATELAAARGELATLADTRAALDAGASEVERLQQALGSATAELERSTASLGELQRVHAEHVKQHEAAVQQQAEQARASAAEHEQDVATIKSLRERLTTLETDRLTVQAAADELRVARGQAAGQLEAIQEQIKILQDQLAATSSARDVLEAQHVDLRTAYEAAVAKVQASEQTLVRLEQDSTEREAALQQERDGLKSELSQALATAEKLGRSLTTAEGERNANAATAKLNATRLAQLETDLANLRQQHETALAEARSECERLSAELTMWAEREPTLSDEMSQARARAQAVEAERDRLADSLAQLERQHGRTSEEAAQRIRTLEQATERLTKERDDLTSRHTASEAARVALEAEREQLGALCDALRAEQERVVTDRVEAVTSRDQEIAALQEQLTEAIARYQSDTGKQSSRTKRLTQERDTAVAALQTAEEKLAASSARLSQLESELTGATQSQARVRAELERTNAQRGQETEKLHGMLATAEQRITEREDELTLLQSQIAELTQAVEDTRVAHADELQRLTREWEDERVTLQAQTGELKSELDRVHKEHYALAEALAADESQPELEIERCVIPGTEDEASADEELEIDDTLVADASLEPEERAPSTIAVIDRETGAAIVAAIEAAGWEAVACEPTSAAVEELASQGLGGAAINLSGGPEAWQAVRCFRQHAATRSVPLMLYAKQSDNLAFSFGAADCVLWPNEPQHLLDTLARLAPRAKRVLAMSTDIDVVATVREQLTGAGLSAAVMLDGRQALELLPSVRPDAAVLHVSASCTDVFRTIVGLRTNGAATLPLVLLLDETPSNRDETFLAAGTRTLASKGSVDVEGIVEAVSWLVALRTKVERVARVPGTDPVTATIRWA